MKKKYLINTVLEIIDASPECIMEDFGLSLDCAAHMGSIEDLKNMICLKQTLGIHIPYNIYIYVINRVKKHDKELQNIASSVLYKIISQYIELYCSDKIYLIPIDDESL